MDGKTDKRQECLTPIATEDDYPTPRFSANDSACESPGPSFGLHSVVDVKGIAGKICHQDTCHTPPKRSRREAVKSPPSREIASDLGPKRVKDRPAPRPVPSYTDVEAVDEFVLPPFNPDDIDGIPIDAALLPEPGPPGKRSSTLVLPTLQNRPLLRRATDFPLLQASDNDDHAPSPRSASVILENVLGIFARTKEDPVSVWRQRRNEFKCPLCLDVLVRPVDVAGCGHSVCRTHVIDLYQHGGSTTGIRCPVCRKEDKVNDFNKIQVDQTKWSTIQRAQFHSARRRSTSPSRSLTPLRERFNRKFLQDNDF